MPDPRRNGDEPAADAAPLNRSLDPSATPSAPRQVVATSLVASAPLPEVGMYSTDHIGSAPAPWPVSTAVAGPGAAGRVSQSHLPAAAGRTAVRTAGTAEAVTHVTGRASARALAVAGSVSPAPAAQPAAAGALASAMAQRPAAAPALAAGTGQTDGPPPAADAVSVPPFSVAQIVAWQVALAAPLFGAGRGRTAFVISIVAAVLILALTMTWWHRQWTYRWALIGLGFARRCRPRHLPDEAIAATLAGGMDVVPLHLDGLDAAVVHGPRGSSVVLLVHAPHCPPAADLVPDIGLVTYMCQVVTHRVAGQGDRHWIVLTASPSLATADVEAELVNRVRRLARRLDRGGTPVAPAGVDDVQELLSCTLGTPDLDGGRPMTVRERWRSWRHGELVHVAASVVREPERTALEALPATPADADLLLVTSAVRARSGATVRVSSAARAMSSSVETAGRLIDAVAGARVAEGRQGPVLRALLPGGAALDIG